MATFLVATMPIPGHVLPMQAVVRALVERGHRVTWYGSRFLRAGIESSGARFEPIRSSVDFGDSDYDRHFPGRRRLTGQTQLKFDFKHVFVDPIAGFLKDLREIQRHLAADVLLSDSAVVAAKIMSDLDGLPWAALNISVLGLQSADVAPFGLGPRSGTTRARENAALLLFVAAYSTSGSWLRCVVDFRASRARSRSSFGASSSATYSMRSVTWTSRFGFWKSETFDHDK